jgi:hypothetical protein
MKIRKSVKILGITFLTIIVFSHIQQNLNSLFSSGVLKKKRYGKTIDAGADIKLIKMVIFAYMYLLPLRSQPWLGIFYLSHPL